MALDGVLANIPGLAGYLGVQEYDQKRALGSLQGVMQLAQAVESAQQAPLKAQMMQSQLAESQRVNQRGFRCDIYRLERHDPEVTMR